MTDIKRPAGVIDQERVNAQAADEVQRWAKKFDATPEQIKEAVGAVGDRASDVEMHLKGSRSTTNADQEERAERITGSR